MGHIDIISTESYLHTTPELLDLAGNGLRRRYRVCWILHGRKGSSSARRKWHSEMAAKPGFRKRKFGAGFWSCTKAAKNVSFRPPSSCFQRRLADPS